MAEEKRLQRILDEGRCIGCGLCAAMLPTKLDMQLAPSGYLRPVAGASLSAADESAVFAICPGVVQTGLPDDLIVRETSVDEIWGPLLRIDKAFAADPEVRHRAATGGVLTALCQYLLASGEASAILHVKAGGARPSFGSAHISASPAEILEGAGSRYGPADPLSALGTMLERGEPFAVVAKPCDISAVRLLGRTDPRVSNMITHMLTPVCGGFMPPFGMDAFLERNDVAPGDVAAVSYRGNGCPGATRVQLNTGDVIEKTYLEFWGTDPSMWHLPWRCKICPDGTGEAADLAAADTWPGGAPSAETLDTDPGTNVILARTKKGAELVENAAKAGYLTLDGTATARDLDQWQPHQVAKKVAFGARLEGMRQAGQLELQTIGLRTRELRQRMDGDTDRRQIDGTKERLAIGKHLDGFGTRG